MRLTEAALNPLRSWSLCACLAIVALAGLSGCASSPAGSDGVRGTDIVTESDEPAIRKRARIRLELGMGYFEQGQTTFALDEVKQALVIDPYYAEAYNARGLIYMRLNDMRFAEESFKRAIELNPGDSNILHNYGWMMCQQGRYGEAVQTFTKALANPTYGARAKTWMAQGLCQAKAGQRAEAEHSLIKAFELDASNPITGYNLALLLYQRGDFARAQFYVKRLNSSELANAESLWLGIKVERRLNNRAAANQLASQLKTRFPSSREYGLFQRGAFDE
jgi:type IV pilus assembly protein PilF